MFGKISQDKSQNFQQKEKVQLLTKEKKKKKNQQKFESNLENQMKRLQGSKFRLLNEFFYTKNSSEASKHFQQNPEEFQEYHRGFQSQVEKWPENPVDSIIQLIEGDKVIQHQELILCDLGCGDGKIEEYFTINKNKVKRVFSYDLVQNKPFIRIADIAHLPRKDRSCDAAIFSLSLMGTNYLEFLEEAFRITRKGGFLIVAEVVSRIQNLEQFISLIELIGYEIIYQAKQKKNNYFCLLAFKKIQREAQIKSNRKLKKEHKQLFQITNDHLIQNYSELSQFLLKPCLYKKR